MSGAKRYLAALAVALLTGCGSPVDSSLVAGSPGEPPQDAPKHLTMVCSRDGSFASGSVLQPLSDGAHFTIDNRGYFKAYLVRPPGADSAHGGPLKPGANEAWTPLQPGQFWIQCYDEPGDASYGADRSPAEVVIEVVDPHGLYQRHDLECDGAEPEFGGHFEGFDEGDRVDEWIRTTIPGITPTDEILHPGYPDTQWKGDFRVIQRDGRRVALVYMWGISVRRCPGADIGS